MKLSLLEIKEVVKSSLGTVVPYIQGSPALGKSSIVKAIADELNLELIDLRLSECDLVDLMGFPVLDGEKATFKPMSIFPLTTDSYPQGKKGWILFVDELSSCNPQIQVAAYKLILDHAVGMHKLHPDCYIVSAGNLITDNAVVQPMSTAMISRMMHLELAYNPDDFLKYAEANNFDSSIVGFLNFRKDYVYTFNADSDKPYASPRTWEMVNKLLPKFTFGTKAWLAMVSGLVGDGIAVEFKSYIELKSEVIEYEQVLANPKKAKVPTELGLQWATILSIVSQTKLEDIEPVFTYLTRYSLDMQIIAIRRLVRLFPSIVDNDLVNDWIDLHVDTLM